MENLIGSKLGRWLVTAEDVERTSQAKHLYCYCTCECGTKKSIRISSILAGESLSCGCLQRETASIRKTTHGCSQHEAWQAYYDMLRRCNDSKRKDFHHYGGKGIRVCKEWQEGWETGEGFKQFLADMGPKPEGKAEIERADRNGDYCKENCYWEDRRAQTNNTSQNRMLEFKGFNLTISEWAHLISIRPQIICDRVNKLAWPVEKALSTPPVKKGIAPKKVIEYKGIDFALNFLLTKEGLTDSFSMSILKKINHV